MANSNSKAPALMTARVLVDCTINDQPFKSGAVIKGSGATLKPYVGVEIDSKAAAVKYALSEGEEVQIVADLETEETEETEESEESEESEEAKAAETEAKAAAKPAT